MSKIASSLVIVAAFVTTFQAAPAHAGRFAEMRAIKQAGLMGQYQVKREMLKTMYPRTGQVRAVVGTAAISAALSGGGTMVLNHFANGMAFDNPALVHTAVNTGLVAGAAFGALQAVSVAFGEVRHSLRISKMARQAVLRQHGLQ